MIINETAKYLRTRGREQAIKVLIEKGYTRKHAYHLIYFATHNPGCHA